MKMKSVLFQCTRTTTRYPFNSADRLSYRVEGPNGVSATFQFDDSHITMSEGIKQRLIQARLSDKSDCEDLKSNAKLIRHPIKRLCEFYMRDLDEFNGSRFASEGSIQSQRSKNPSFSKVDEEEIEYLQQAQCTSIRRDRQGTEKRNKPVKRISKFVENVMPINKHDCHDGRIMVERISQRLLAFDQEKMHTFVSLVEQQTGSLLQKLSNLISFVENFESSCPMEFAESGDAIASCEFGDNQSFDVPSIKKENTKKRAGRGRVVTGRCRGRGRARTQNINLDFSRGEPYLTIREKVPKNPALVISKEAKMLSSAASDLDSKHSSKHGPIGKNLMKFVANEDGSKIDLPMNSKPKRGTRGRGKGRSIGASKRRQRSKVPKQRSRIFVQNTTTRGND